MGKTTKRTATVATAVVLTVGAGTAAFAYASGWFQGGGTASAASSTIQNVTTTVTVPNDAAHRLFPGKTVSVTGNITNPNDYKVRINSVAVTGVTSVKNNVNNPDCVTSTADLSAVLTPAPLDIAAATTLPNNTFGTLSMGNNAVPQCAGSQITVTLTFDGELVP
ncbi:hypothetical protein ACIBSW_03560 [Actinoplanes sp. NPDC049668]|uniref:hypothetical protein n=1 Tax=unclassified Actinoplanes TaxID=2626549 RepID=UPI0033B2A271